jgi:hypothetical protein
MRACILLTMVSKVCVDGLGLGPGDGDPANAIGNLSLDSLVNSLANRRRQKREDEYYDRRSTRNLRSRWGQAFV